VNDLRPFATDNPTFPYNFAVDAVPVNPVVLPGPIVI
jgi:hypothetical protein